MDEKDANIFPFHNLPPNSTKILKSYFLFFSPIPLLDKRIADGESYYSQYLRSNAKHPSQFSHRIIELATLLGNNLKVGLPWKVEHI